MFERLRADHQKIRQTVASFLVLLNKPELCDIEVLASFRWSLASTILQHLPVEDRQVFRRLESSPLPNVRALAAQSRQVLNSLYERFGRHTEEWQQQAIVADWTTYRAQTQPLVTELLDRINYEESVLYPLAAKLADPGTERRIGDRNWAGDAGKIKARIH